MNINRNDKSTSISTQMDTLIPPSKISNITQGFFVGAVSDNFDERIHQKIFHSEIVPDNQAITKEIQQYQPIPVITNFIDGEGMDQMQNEIDKNYKRIKIEVTKIINMETQCLKGT